MGESDQEGVGHSQAIAPVPAAALHLDIIEEEGGFALDNGLKEGSSALAGGGTLRLRRRRR